MDFTFSWDDNKADANLRKHRVSFQEACTLFQDPFVITYPDSAHSVAEVRYLSFGVSSTGTLLVVSHTETASGLRIISARKMDRAERKIYEQH